MKVIEMTEQQQAMLLELIDLANKAGGIRVAQAALTVYALVQNATTQPDAAPKD